MGTLSEELAPHAERLVARPRIYADANVPAGLVAYMRRRLQWDVLFVLEEEGLRRAPDITHYQLAQQLRRTLLTMDRDYLDDRLPALRRVRRGIGQRPPPTQGAGAQAGRARRESDASGEGSTAQALGAENLELKTDN